MPKSADFLMKTEECISAGSVTMLEYFVLEYIIQYCSQEQLTISAEVITIIYDAVSTISSCLDIKCDIPLGNKNQKEISSFLKTHHKILEEFEKRSICQLCQ